MYYTFPTAGFMAGGFIGSLAMAENGGCLNVALFGFIIVTIALRKLLWQKRYAVYEPASITLKLTSATRVNADNISFPK